MAAQDVKLPKMNMPKMKMPKMILFDYGHTLCHEPGFDGVRGTEAIMKYAAYNKDNLSAAEINAFAESVYRGITQDARNAGAEAHNLIYQRFVYEYLKIGFSLPNERIEQIFWDGASPGEMMPGADTVLDYLESNGIRSGVVSNMSFSGANLAKRLDRLFPRHSFEFVIASSEYMYRKPNKILFELALRKAELAPGDVWFCGDSVGNDIFGAAGAGIFPVWYHSVIECYYKENKGNDERPACEHLYIRNWPELIEALENLKL